MMPDHDFDALLAAALRRRGRPAPFPVDVADRVMARVAVIGVPSRAELDPRQLRRWAIAAAAAGVALAAAAIGHAPSASATIAGLAHAAANAAGAAMKLVPTASSLAETAGRIAIALATSARTSIQPLEPFQPLARTLLAALTVVMVSVTAVVVGRDVTRTVADKERA
jgi:hypothetical protein